MVNMKIMIITISLIHKNQNSNDKIFQGIMGDFLESIVWSSLENFKGISSHMVILGHFQG
jgi:hypothetical protein